MVYSAVVPAAGLGTRMLPFSKEVPKEMLPLITGYGRNVFVVPVLHYVFDSLYDAGVRRFSLLLEEGRK